MAEPAQQDTVHGARGQPVITVITVCRNPGALLDQAVASVHALGRTDVEHLVVDGASSDGTAERLRAGSLPVARWISEPDRGIYDAMNKGWALAAPASWILFIGADDRVLELPSAAELAAAAQRGASLVLGEVQAGEQRFVSVLGPALRIANTIHHQGQLVHKAAHPGPPFDTGYRVFGDWEFNVRLWRAGARAEPLVTLRCFASPGGLSARRPLAEAVRLVHQHFGAWAALETALRVVKRNAVARWRARRQVR